MKPEDRRQPALWLIDLAAVTLCLAVTAGVGIGLVRPIFSRRATLTQQASQLVQEQQKCSRLSAAVLALRQRTNALQEELATGAVQLDGVDQMNHRIAHLTALLRDCGLELEDIQTQSPVPHRRCDIVPLRIVGLGGYPNSAAFLAELHRQRPDIAVLGFSLTGAPGVAGYAGQFAFDLCWFAAPSRAADPS